MTTAMDQLGKQTKELTADLQEIGRTVSDAAREGVQQVRERASEYCEEGREKVHGMGCACERLVRERPLRSLLIAAGIGVLLGHFWLRR